DRTDLGRNCPEVGRNSGVGPATEPLAERRQVLATPIEFAINDEAWNPEHAKSMGLVHDVVVLQPPCSFHECRKLLGTDTDRAQHLRDLCDAVDIKLTPPEQLINRIVIPLK